MYYNAQEIGARVRLLRKQSSMSQNEFAEMIGISRIYVAKIEAGTGNPSIDVLIEIAERLQVSLDYLVFGRPNARDVKTELRNIIRILTEIEEKL